MEHRLPACECKFYTQARSLCSARAFAKKVYPLNSNFEFRKSRRDNTLLTVGFNLRQDGTHHQVPQGRHFAQQVSSLRDLVEGRPYRRLKPTVNKVLSLRDWAHSFGKCSSSAPQKNPMRLTVWALLALLFCLAQGCLIIPFPHTQCHADGVQGRVVDEDGMPVPNVTVISPAKKMTGVNVGKREAITDADGYFMLNPVRGWHWGYFMPFFVTGTGNVSIWPYFDPYLEGISTTSELQLFADGFPEQKFTPSHWRNPSSTWSPSVKGRESEFFIYNRVYVDDNWENIGHDDKASKVSKEGNTIVASEIMLHRQTTSNYLAAATHKHITDSLDVTSILLCEMYSPAHLTVKCVIQGTNPVATLFGNRFYHYDLRVITDTNLIATIVSELSAPAEISTLVIPANREERLEDILCCMVLYSSSKPMRIGHVVKRDGTVLNTRIEWMGSSKGSLSFSQHTADTTWSVRSETIADLVREALPRKNDSKKGER